MTELLNSPKINDSRIDPLWVENPGVVCRVRVVSNQGIVRATAIRLPTIFVESANETQALKDIANQYRTALIQAQRLLPFSQVGEELSGTRTVEVAMPTIRNIDNVYDQSELTDDEEATLEQLRETGSARPTVPLTSCARS